MVVKVFASILAALAILLVASFVLKQAGVMGSNVEHGLVSMAVSPTGNTIVFTSAKGELWCLDLASRQVRLLSETGTNTSPAVSRDGKSVFFASSAAGRGPQLFQIGIDGSGTRPLTSDTKFSDSSPCPSADGKRVAFIRGFRFRPYSMGGMVWDDYDICELELATGKVRQLTHEKFYSCANPVYVEQDQKIAFDATRHGSDLTNLAFEVSSGSVRSKANPYLPPSGDTHKINAWISSLSGSPDGTRIAFISDRVEPFKYDVATAKNDGSDLRVMRFTEISRYNQNPVFSADGKTIYVLAGTEWNNHMRPIYSLYALTLDGKPTKVAGSGLFTDPATWDGK